MTATPKWYLPTAILALAWNLLGCFAYLKDAMLTPEDLAHLSAAQQALYAARPALFVGAYAIAVWGGAAGCIGLIWRRRWARPLLIASLAALVVQDATLMLLSRTVAPAAPAALVLQSLVLLVAIGLVVLARQASARGWIT